MAQETLYLDAPEITISDKRLVARGQTHALKAGASFRKHSEALPQPSKGVWLLLMALAVLLLVLPGAIVIAGGMTAIGLAQVVVGGALAYAAFGRYRHHAPRYRHTFFLTGAAGEVAAYDTADERLAAAVESSLAQALARRG